MPILTVYYNNSFCLFVQVDNVSIALLYSMVSHHVPLLVNHSVMVKGTTMLYAYQMKKEGGGGRNRDRGGNGSEKEEERKREREREWVCHCYCIPGLPRWVT